MTVLKLKQILSYYQDDFEVTIQGGVIRVNGKYHYSNPHGIEEYINTKGCVWEGGTGVAPDGTYCGECSRFEGDKCGWEERK